MSELIDVFWQRIHYYGGPHNLSVAIEAEAVKSNWHTVAHPTKTYKKCKWKQWEINYLLMHWRHCKHKDIALRINRSYVAVRSRAYLLRKSGLI